MAVGREIHRHAGNCRRQVGPVIEIEAAQVVLIRFALSAVLRDHDSRNGLQYLAAAHDRTRVELPRRGRSLTRGLRDADQILGWPLGIGDVHERPLAGHGDVGVQGQAQDDVHGGRRAAGDDREWPSNLGKVDQREIQLVLARRQIEAITSTRIGHGLLRRAGAGMRLDRNPGKGATALVANGARHPLGKDSRPRRQQGSDPDTPERPPSDLRLSIIVAGVYVADEGADVRQIVAPRAEAAHRRYITTGMPFSAETGSAANWHRCRSCMQESGAAPASNCG